MRRECFLVCLIITLCTFNSSAFYSYNQDSTGIIIEKGDNLWSIMVDLNKSGFSAYDFWQCRGDSLAKHPDLIKPGMIFYLNCSSPLKGFREPDTTVFNELKLPLTVNIGLRNNTSSKPELFSSKWFQDVMIAGLFALVGIIATFLIPKLIKALLNTSNRLKPTHDFLFPSEKRSYNTWIIWILIFILFTSISYYFFGSYLTSEKNTEAEVISVSTSDPTISTEEEIKDDLSKYVIPACAVLVTLIIGILQLWLSRRNQNDNILLQATGYLTGKTQRRSVGISLIEGLVTKGRYRSSLMPLLFNQFYYLLIIADPDGPIKDFQLRKIPKNKLTPEIEERIQEERSIRRISRGHEEINIKRLFNLLIILISHELKHGSSTSNFYQEENHELKNANWLDKMKKIIKLRKSSTLNKDEVGLTRSYLFISKDLMEFWGNELERVSNLQKTKSDH